MEYECIKEVCGRDECNCPKCIQERIDEVETNGTDK